MEHIFWLRENKVAGRSGPDANAWDLEEIKTNGFSAILSVNDGRAVDKSMVFRLGMGYSCIPMSANIPVREGDKELCLKNLPKAIEFIRQNMRGGPVLIHCHSGKDRTGMVLAAYLIEFEDYSVSKAVEEVIAVRPIAFSAEGWMEFVQEVLHLFKTQKKSY